MQKNIYKLFLIVFIGGGIFLSLFLFTNAYSPHVTHAPLADKSSDLYNKFYSTNALTVQEREWIMQGSADEDDPLLRTVHHFYDPINNKGLPGYTSSKIWARDGAAQYGIGGDYSWEEALAAYKRGDKEKAYKALGHIIHLIQDATVPAHVRNDPHPPGEILYSGADPFEQAVKDMDKFKISPATGLSPIIYSDLDTYFDKTALYTNTHFYSKNSVGFYKKPIPTRVDDNYVYGRDKGGEYRLIKLQKPDSRLIGGTIPMDSMALDDPLVLQDYWNRLAPFAIENGAGIIKLFHDSLPEVVAAEEYQSWWQKTTGFVSEKYNNTLSGISSIIQWSVQLGQFIDSSDVQVEISGRDLSFTESLMTGASRNFQTDLIFSLNTPEEDQNALQNFSDQLQIFNAGPQQTTPTEPEPEEDVSNNASPKEEESTSEIEIVQNTQNQDEINLESDNQENISESNFFYGNISSRGSGKNTEEVNQDEDTAEQEGEPQEEEQPTTFFTEIFDYDNGPLLENSDWAKVFYCIKAEFKVVEGVISIFNPEPTGLNCFVQRSLPYPLLSGSMQIDWSYTKKDSIFSRVTSMPILQLQPGDILSPGTDIPQIMFSGDNPFKKEQLRNSIYFYYYDVDSRPQSELLLADAPKERVFNARLDWFTGDNDECFVRASLSSPQVLTDFVQVRADRCWMDENVDEKGVQKVTLGAGYSSGLYKSHKQGYYADNFVVWENNFTIDNDQEQEEEQSLHLVTRVIDGDTIELENGERVRYIGVNTPEMPDDCFAEEATDYNSQLVLDKYVLLEEGPNDKDDYGRLLRYIYMDDIFVNQLLVETGHAYAFDYGYTHDFTDEFENIEEEAKENKRGLWGDACHPEEDGTGLNHLVITNVQLASEDSKEDEYIIIHNPAQQDVSLSGWSIQRTTKSGTVYKKNFKNEHVISAGGYFKIANSQSSATIKDSVDMLHNSFSLTKDNTVFLVNSHDEISTGEESTIVDKVGFGEAFSPESEPTTNPQDGEEIVRLSDDNLYIDTDNNLKDFKIVK